LGVHVVAGGLALPEEGCLVGDVYIPAIGRGAALRVVFHEQAAIDTGTLHAYREANLAWLAARGEAVWSGPNGARVDGPRRMVVWEGAESAARGAPDGAVVTPFGTFPVDSQAP
jgi:mannose-1-phosphate guanylyltransferase